MPDFWMFSRLSIMLMPYLVLYRSSRCFSLSHGKLSQLKQYFASALIIFSQFLILQAAQDFGLLLSSPRQPGHCLRSLMNALHRRQFIPQGAIRFMDIAAAFFGPFEVIAFASKHYLRFYCLSQLLSRNPYI
jgi:hypothetical protein